MLLHGLVFLLQPIGDPSSFNFKEMYQQCAAEDHDITPLDFVFEHLLNFECIINLFEGESEDEHQPFHTVESATPFAVVIPRPITLAFSPQAYLADRIKYPLHNAIFLSSNFELDIFRPPAIS